MRTHKWSKLAAQVRARPGAEERLAAVRRETEAELSAYQQTLAEMQKGREAAQAALTEELGASEAQGALIQQHVDSYLALLQAYLDSLGGRLELRAVFDGVQVPIRLDELCGSPGGCAVQEEPDADFTAAPEEIAA